jgi:ABC-type glycerol-3-phosphate transport system substrate-binding protein
MQVIVQQNQKTNIKAYATWAGPAGRATMIGGDVIAIPKRSPNQELALKFAAYLMSREVQTLLVTELGWPPIRSDALGSVPEWQQEFFQAIMEALRYGHYRPAIMGWSAVDKYVNLAFKDIIMDGRDVQTTLDTYARDLQEELDWLK